MEEEALKTFKDWLDTKDYSDCTYNCYLGGIKDFFAHGFTEITVENELAYRQALINEHKKGNTVNIRIHALNMYNKLVGLPRVNLVKLNREPFAINGMEIEDYQQILNKLLETDKYKWYVAIKLLATTGMRIGEATGVTYGDLRRGYAIVYGKGRKERTVYFSQALKETLYLYIKDKPDDEKIIPHSPHYVRNAFSRIKRRCGLNCKTSPHEYRRFFSREMYEITKDVSLIQGLLGHESIATTSNYVKPTHKNAMNKYYRSQNW